MEFRDIYKEHAPMIWAVISRHVFDMRDREDLFQDIFIKAHKGLPKFRHESGIKTWIYRIAVNESMNFLKKRNRADRFINLLKTFRHEEGTEAEAGDEGVLERPLKKLNPKQRAALIMSEVEGMPLKDIGESLNMPLGTVKSTLSRAKETVRKEVEKEGSL